MVTIELSEEAIENLKIFLGRTNLTGAEVMAYTEIIKSIYEAKKVVATSEPTEEGGE